MNIVIHRGTHQIGGCVTEISAGNDKVFIDFGSDLPGMANPAPLKSVPGLTVPDGSNGALFFTHYHGDHTGRLNEVRPGLPIYMGATAREIFLKFLKRTRSPFMERADSIKPCFPKGNVRVGRIVVTPLAVDHSAFDSRMFVIAADGQKVLHTGDFRMHGFRGGKVLPTLKKYATDIDCVVCENTTLSRAPSRAMNECELQNRAKDLMKEHKYVFVVCASTNIDRIGAFYHARPDGRLFVCDEYQKDILNLVTLRHGGKSKFYNFPRVLSYARNLDAKMEEKGFCMLIRQGKEGGELLNRYRGRDLVIYSMWDGYLEDGPARSEGLVKFLQNENFVRLHTSGHANPEAIAALCETVRPKRGVIPIHGEKPEHLKKILPGLEVFCLKDGESFAVGGTAAGTVPQLP